MAINAQSNKLFELIDREDKLERLATGFVFTEGPIWNATEACLYFSDMPGDTRRRWSAADGITVVRQPSNKCNGMTYDGTNRLVVCEHSTSSVIRETGESREVLASHYHGKELNSPNDVVVARDGSIYFTDPTYGRMPGFGVERDQELTFQGLYRIPADGGELQLLADDFGQPNGLCFSPGESQLYVNDSAAAHIRVFDIHADGQLKNDRIFVENVGTGDFEVGVVDGMKCDEHGNIWVTGPGGIWIFDSEGSHLGVLEVPEKNVGNLNWGGNRWSDLYIGASASLYRIHLRVAGNRSSYMG